MGLLDMLGNLSPEQTQGLLAAAAQISEASGPSRVKPNVMGALAQGGLAYTQSIDGQRRKKLEEEAAQQALKINGYKLQDAESDYQKQQRTREAEQKYADYMKGRATGFPMAAGAQVADRVPLVGPSTASAPAASFGLPTAEEKVAEARELYGLGLVEQAKAAMAEAQKLQPEYSQTPQVANDPNGNPFLYVMDKRGKKLVVDGALPREKMETIGLGGHEQVINPYELKPGQKFARSMTPDGIAADARARQANALKEREVAAGGKPPPGYRWTPEGSLAAIPGGPGDKLPESQQKQLVGVNNVRTAIAEYRKTLEGFSGRDALKPDARAAMGTKYNNMMLQAKEAYNLGVLNGPDLDILQSVITDPRSLKGAFVSKKALDTQAVELDRMMAGMGEVSSNARQPQQNAKPSAASDSGKGAKVATLADIAETARKSGKATAEVTAALKAKGYTIGGN